MSVGKAFKICIARWTRSWERSESRLSWRSWYHIATMLIRPLGTPIVKQCSRASLSTAAKGIAASVQIQTSEARCFSTTNPRTFSSLPHHLARQNNGMVNVFVKSTKVPRPIAMVPHVKHKVKNQLKEKKVVLEKPKEDVPSHFSYAGLTNMPITSELKIITPEEDVPSGIWPVFRMMVRSIIAIYFISFCLYDHCHYLSVIDFFVGWERQLSSSRHSSSYQLDQDPPRAVWSITAPIGAHLAVPSLCRGAPVKSATAIRQTWICWYSIW